MRIQIQILESKMNPMNPLNSLGFIKTLKKMNLNLNLKYTEKPFPRFKSAPPHLWKGVQIDIEGRWLESIDGREELKSTTAQRLIIAQII